MAEELLPETRRALRHRLATAQAEGRAPAMAAGVTRAGVRLWADGRGSVGDGPPDAGVAFRIGSITKTFTAVLVMRLRDEGLIDLGDAIGRHVPDVGPAHVTVAELLAHTAGIVAEPPGPWWERTPGTMRPDVPSMLGDDPVVHEPGRRFHYSNPGYGVLGALVEAKRGRPWSAALDEEILGPLGLRDTSVAPPSRRAQGWATHPWADVLMPEPAHDYGPMNPAGVLWSTVDDLCRWATFLLDGAPQVLSAASLAEMRQPTAPPEGTSSYGLGLQVSHEADGRVLTGHGGSVPGFLASIWVSPADDVGAVVLCNTTGGVAIGGLGVELLRIVAEREPGIPAAWEPRSDPALLEIAGPWYWGPTPLAIRVREGRDLELTGLVGRARATPLRAEPDGTWIGLEGYYAGERLRVVRDPASGAVTHLDLGTFVLTRAPYDRADVVPGGVDPEAWQRS